MKPDLQIAPNSYVLDYQIYFDLASKMYGIRNRETQIKDNVYVSVEKCMELTKEQLIKVIKDATYLLNK